MESEATMDSNGVSASAQSVGACGVSSSEADQEVVMKARDLQALIVQKDEALAKASVLETELQRALHDLECVR
jgi:hypothetical protein